MEKSCGDRDSASCGLEIREKPLRAVNVAVRAVHGGNVYRYLTKSNHNHHARCKTPYFYSKNHLARAAARGTGGVFLP